MGANPRKTKAKGADNAPGSGPAASTAAIEARVDAVDWTKVQAELDAQGWAVAPKLLTHAEADSIAGLYSSGAGLPQPCHHGTAWLRPRRVQILQLPAAALVQALRTAAYPHLAPIANQWQERMGKELRFPGDHAAFLERCHQAGQTRPTPLLLEYAPEDYNCLHRDLYGEHVFPLQIAILLDQPGEDFEGGEFVMTEQRPRMQTRAMVLPLKEGRRRRLRGQQPPDEGGARRLSGEAEPRRQQASHGQAAHRRRDLPRCALSPFRSQFREPAKRSAATGRCRASRAREAPRTP